MQAHRGEGGLSIDNRIFRKKLKNLQKVKIFSETKKKEISTKRMINIQPTWKKRRGVFKLCLPLIITKLGR